MKEVFLLIRYCEILRLKHEGFSQRGIASSTGHSRQIIKEVISRAEIKDLTLQLSDDITDIWLHGYLFPEKSPTEKGRRIPNYDDVHKELAKKGVTLSLLWEEYCQLCESEKKIPYSYRQFCRGYNDFAQKTKATLRIKRKPGEVLEVDWAGTTATIIDEATGEIIPAYIFVATLPCSQYTYVEAFLTMETSSWITGHINAFEYFGGVTEMIVPDNLRTGVTKSDKYMPVINRSYQEMAEYYQTAIVPARVRKPTDKANVEGTVGHISTWILAALRNYRIFSLIELNDAIKEKLTEVNTKMFTKKGGSRLIAFEEEEKFALKKLPLKHYELSTWRTITVGRDYHIEIDKMFYSVPYEYIKHQVETRVTTKTIEVFYKNIRIASHKKLEGKPGQIHTIQSHMPDNHQQYVQHNRKTSLEWAKSIGPCTESILETIFEKYKVEAQALKISLGFMKLADKYSKFNLEKACRQSLEYSSQPDLKSIQLILALQAEKKRERTDNSTTKKEVIKSKAPAKSNAFTRGANYYGGQN